MDSRKKFMRYATIAYVLVGIGLTLHAEYFLSPSGGGTVAAKFDGAPDSVRTLVDASAAEAQSIYDESKGTEPFVAGLAAWTKADLTGDAYWSRKAIGHLSAAGDDPLALAYKGAAHTVFARDYPYKGAWQAFPGPGFARIYHVLRGKAQLNNAVAASDGEATTVLLRAASFAGLPSLFGGADVADSDFATLSDGLSPNAADPFSMQVRVQQAVRLTALDDPTAEAAWADVARLADDGTLERGFAEWMASNG